MTTHKTLADLHHELDTCRLCAEAGHVIESLPVFSRVTDARAVLIGQAPGKAEVGERVPFSGDAGKRLFEWMHRAGWDEDSFRQAVYITSVTKCFPGDNPRGPGDRPPSAAERKLCRPWLDGELRLLQPELIIAVGSMAVKVFYPTQLRLVDVIGESMVDSDGRHILPLPHPSGASRWLNDPHNVGRLEQALYRLKTLKAELDL